MFAGNVARQELSALHMRNVDVIIWPVDDGLVVQTIISGPHIGDSQRAISHTFASWREFLSWLLIQDGPSALSDYPFIRHVCVVPPTHARRSRDGSRWEIS